MKKTIYFIMLLCCILMFWSLCLDVKNNFEDIKTSQKYQMMMLQKFSLMQTAESDLIRGCKK